MYQIDLNSDMGESFGRYKLGDDAAMLEYISTANVACGWHAGDPMVMDNVVRLASQKGVAVGAHPGNPDLLGFGRRKIDISPAELKNYVKYQMGALKAFTDTYHIPLHHMIPHGVWGGQSQTDEQFCEALCDAVCEFDKDMLVFYIAGTLLGEVAKSRGLRTAAEIFSDRAYLDDGTLTPRSMPGAVITDEKAAIARSVRMVKEHKVVSITGKELDIHGDTLCIHGDGIHALEFAKKITESFQKEGIQIRSLA